MIPTRLSASLSIGSPRDRRRCSRSPSGWCGTSGPRTTRCRRCPAAWARASARPEADELRGEAHRRGWCVTVQRDFASSQSRRFDLGLEQRVFVEAEVLADALAVREDLRRMRVLLRRHVAGLFEQRQVDQEARVALRAGISVPVPGAAEVAALLDDPDVLDANFRQPRCGGEPGKTATDESEGDVIGFRRARRDRRIGIVEIVRELPRDPQVLIVAVGTQPLVALLQILLAEPLLVDRSVLRGLRLVGHRHPKAPFRKS